VFLDRDGVLVDDQGLLLRAEQIRLLAGVPAALQRLKAAGLFLATVSNQAAVARGLIDEEELGDLNELVLEQIVACGGPRLDAVYYCPHHPEATLPEYRTACPCRKPRPGMILRAAAEHGLDLAASFLVGDRMTDIAAGAAAGCRTVLVTCGRHAAPPIVTVDPIDPACRPDHTCLDLAEAAQWILALPTEKWRART
jgi:D-glycero-D-manno-heptose 1,7-bisphosphate phosphatase